MRRFNKAVLEIDKGDGQVIMMTFQAGLVNLDHILSLGKTTPMPMTDLLFKTQKYVNEENVLVAKSLTGKQNKDEELICITERRTINSIIQIAELARLVQRR